ncbi:MAG: LacI family transcriptional regulator, partial [Mesorhizobium sp.]
MRSTLTDIAREAGVSPATVDRVLNNRPGVRARTRE